MADRRAFVCGHPIAHSRSPLLHGHWLEAYGIDGSYEAIDVVPEAFPAFLAALRDGHMSGGNVTIPHKEAAFAGVDRHDEAASAIGAVNTIWIEDGRLCGGNTDAYGFAANLDEHAPGWDRRDAVALVIGAGGAARAVVHALLTRGFGQVRIANRTVDRAGDLAGRFGAKVSAHGMSELGRLGRDAALVVNTTSVGMHGTDGLELDMAALAPGCVVTDLVYVPLETPFLAAARAAGHVVVDGLGMLLHQAVPGFERWFGVRPEVTPELRAVVAASLGVRAA
jgi:shikimate dehydrogenase